MEQTMKLIHRILSTLFMLYLLVDPVFAIGLSEDSANEPDPGDNMKRTTLLIDHIEDYLRDNDAYVGVIARRGAGDPKTGVSDVDNLDLSGMAHCGFVIKNGFGKNAQYITFNLVRMKSAKKIGDNEYDMSELRAWTLPHFFIGSFEKDAIVFLPPKKVQLKLWNLLRANGQLEIEPNKRYLKNNKGRQLVDTNGKAQFVTDQIVTNGAFTFFHNPEYNLLSDYAEASTQNCNEHLLKTYIGFRDFWSPSQSGYDITDPAKSTIFEINRAATTAIVKNFTPRQMTLSRTKSTFAFVQNIRFGERYSKSPTLFGFKLNKERFDVVSVDSFCDPKNQSFLSWADFKVFREDYSKAKGYMIRDLGKDYVKVNRITGKKNSVNL